MADVDEFAQAVECPTGPLESAGGEGMRDALQVRDPGPDDLRRRDLASTGVLGGDGVHRLRDSPRHGMFCTAVGAA